MSDCDNCDHMVDFSGHQSRVASKSHCCCSICHILWITGDCLPFILLHENPQRPPKNKLKISCFRHENFSSEPPKPEVVEHFLTKELVKSEFEQSAVIKRDWTSNLREAANALFRVIGSRWVVPWTAETILQVMLLWTAAFWFIGSWMIPFAAHITGLAGVAILLHCLSRFRPLPPDWFRFSLRGNWQVDVVMGCLMFPLVNRLSQFNLTLLPLLPSSPATFSSVEQSIMARDPVAMALYAIVVSICAPVWEEIVFRGFLLPSLTKYMPVWCAILKFIAIRALA
ncbi:CAAX amino terminal protease family protein [Quillaja saponaria]|uniref:CAAX amino terminal protease family protein n=1 Tax=Quillaja saponaria TaxID=32244 RepID=A0AAD7L601_QUISA|nr:CAAX amino terminal protease family protein [Quillaja saponaria]